MSAIRLFKVWGITVYLDWLWFFVAFYQIKARSTKYHNPAWAVAEFLSLFVLVLTHEFGHALACRSVGGHAERILLWPLGGLAFVDPPPRPGALLWSIAAGPLVNVAMVPVLLGLFLIGRSMALPRDLLYFLLTVNIINGVLLVFNLMPVYPLDGGQILQSILWFFLGYARSLRIAAWIGMGAAALLLAYAIAQMRPWLVLVTLFIGWRAWKGHQTAKRLLAQGPTETVVWRASDM